MGLAAALNSPLEKILDDSFPQSNPAQAILEWVESPMGPGFLELERMLGKMLAHGSPVAKEFIGFAIPRDINRFTTAEIQPFVQFLRRQTGDNSIDVAFFREDGLKLILSGSPEALARLASLETVFDSNSLKPRNTCSAKTVYRVHDNTTDARKARLVQALRLRTQFLLNTRAFERERMLQNLERALDLERSLQLNRNAALKHSERALDLERALKFVRKRALQRERNRTLRISVLIASVAALGIILTGSGAMFWAVAIASGLAIAIATVVSSLLNHLEDALEFDHESALEHLQHALALKTGLEPGSERVVDYIQRTLELAISLDPLGDMLDLQGADLRGCNLRNIDLRRTDLRDVDFTDADVSGTIFGDNRGVAERDHSNLQRRGAIIQES